MTRRDIDARLAATATWPLPNRDQIREQLATCATCGGAYLDTDIGHDSHEVVMGHRPAKARDPTTDHRQNADEPTTE